MENIKDLFDAVIDALSDEEITKSSIAESDIRRIVHLTQRDEPLRPFEDKVEIAVTHAKSIIRRGGEALNEYDDRFDKHKYDNLGFWNHIVRTSSGQVWQDDDLEAVKCKVEKRAKAVGYLVNPKHELNDELDIPTGSTHGNRIERKYGKPLSVLAGIKDFSQQPSLAGSSCFLVSRKHIVTAAHSIAIKEADGDTFIHRQPDEIEAYVRELGVIFNYEENPANTVQDSFAGSIHFAKNITFLSKLSSDIDVAILELWDEVDEWIPSIDISMRDESYFDKSVVGKKVYTIGHPRGLPKKITIDGEIKSNYRANQFATTLDLFKGCSGSPVFDCETHSLIGVCVSAYKDFIVSGENVVHTTGCSDDVSKTIQLFEGLNSFISELNKI